MTLKEYIADALCSGGIQEAQAVSVTFKSGEVVTVHSGDHPILSRDADEVDKIEAKQTAQGGC